MSDELLLAEMRLVVATLRRRALHGWFSGQPSREDERYLRRCTLDHDTTPEVGTRLIFTRDIGHHTSGWWKNPDYERCWHLSMSAVGRLVTAVGMRPMPVGEMEARIQRLWVEAFFGEDLAKVWVEPAYYDAGKRHHVTHWRLFCDERWQPIIPRGEVYSRELTEAGWKSASEVLAARTAVLEGSR